MTRIAPGLTGAVLRTSREAHVTERGPEVQTDLIIPPELFEQYRQGWRCPSCHTVQDEARPKVCKTVWRDTGEHCGFPIRDKLDEWLQLNFRGEETLWPDHTDQYAAEDEEKFWVPQNGILVPRSA